MMLNIADFDPITLEEMDKVAALRTRIDRKYIVDSLTAGKLLESLSSCAALEIDGKRSFNYRSVYFDSPDFASYRSAAHRRRRRYKIRSRSYLDAGICKLEVKLRSGGKKNTKKRFDYALDRSRVITDEGRSFIESAVGDLEIPTRLEPVLTTQYERSTLVDLNSSARLTCDENLVCEDWEGNQISLDYFVFETKSDGPPSSFDRLLWENKVRPIRISKFCTGLAALHPELPSNKWHRTLNRYFFS
ncbi:MAG: molecular chaperone [Actinobacteria bacterium]|nr:molecular chaperone [Actinomycetota bacterium]MDG2211558.1 polyphosphate polymerase domain-containing protein [Acidimicrobiales bacterium]